MVTWGVTNSYTVIALKVILTNLGKRGCACRFTSKPRQQPLTEASSTGVDHTSASPGDTNQFGANGSCSARGFHWETDRRVCDAFSVRGKKLEPERACTLFVHLWKVKAFWWGHDEPSASLYLIFWNSGLAKKGLLLIVRALVVKGQSILLRTWSLRPDKAVEPVHH